MTKYNYLIVGSGLFGAVFAQQMREQGKSCLVIDRRSHIAGNAYTYNCCGINVHQYGAHIFHTSNQQVWDYVNRFAQFNNYINSPIARYHDQLYNLPFNMNTFSKMWGIVTPQQAKDIIAEQISQSGIVEATNLEEQAIRLVGTDVYEKLVKHYTQKQWGRPCDQLPSFIINRLPLRFTYDNNYFSDRYQGIPIGGYTAMIEHMLEGTEVLLDTDYHSFIADNENIADTIVYTGAIDEFFEYSLGKLQYRSVRFDTQILDTDNYQGNAVVNYTDDTVPYTRIIEHRHFEQTDSSKTVISTEYSCEWSGEAEPYYPINDQTNNSLYQQYLQLSSLRTDVIFGGRLGLYRYMDMDKVILSALETVDALMSTSKK